MRPVRIMLATLLLNEEEWLDNLYRQHANWPGVVGWAFVEGADPQYRKCNPEMVSAGNTSVDGTTNYLRKLAKANQQVHHYEVPAFEWQGQPDQGKCHLRNGYWWIAESLCPDWVVQLDADEFYSHEDQRRITDLLSNPDYEYDAIMLRQRHVWYPPFTRGVEESWDKIVGGFERSKGFDVVCDARQGLFHHEVVGGYWQVPHTRVWRWRPGTRHVRNHNWPEYNGKYLTQNMLRCDLMDQHGLPQCVHLGYASSAKSRKAKHGYYVVRGEGDEPGRLGRRRRMYVECREAWENWDGFAALPHGAKVRRYDGPVPECFRS